MWLNPVIHLDVGEYGLLLRVYDSQMLFQDSSITVEMCDCKGGDVKCLAAVRAAYISTLYIYVLAVILCLLCKQLTYCIFIWMSFVEIHCSVGEDLYFVFSVAVVTSTTFEEKERKEAKTLRPDGWWWQGQYFMLQWGRRRRRRSGEHAQMCLFLYIQTNL